MLSVLELIGRWGAGGGDEGHMKDMRGFSRLLTYSWAAGEGGEEAFVPPVFLQGPF